MIEFSAVILKFAEQGDKTGWSYIEVLGDIARQLKPGNKKAFRVRGFLDSHKISGIALLPMGEGNFIMPLNAQIRKLIGKREGAVLQLSLEEDTDYKLEPPVELLECLEEEPESLDFFYSLAKSHRDYFVKWIDSAKTIETRTKRIVNTLNAMKRKQSYGEMIRSLKNIRL